MNTLAGARIASPRALLAGHRWLALRRLSQLVILGLFMAGPWFGVWLLKGNLSSSLILDVVPMNDPLILLQSLAAGHWPEAAAFTGVLVVLALYLLVGGRTYCAWVCPVNAVTDAAGWLRRRLDLKTSRTPPRETRYWLLGAILVAALATGSIAWELVNPVSMAHRGLIFGFGLGWIVVAAIFAYDLAVAARGWCGHLCPVGAFYGLINRAALLKVSAAGRRRCDDCMDCFEVCPEPQVIRPALKGSGAATPLIIDGTCTNCARCIDVCSKDVFRFTHRFDKKEDL